MARRTFYDIPGGDTIVYDVVDESNGYRQQSFLFKEKDRVDTFMSIRCAKCRDDDIVLLSYPKAGSNWLWEMMRMMIHKTSEVGDANKVKGMLEAMPLSFLDDMPSPRILNTHLKVRYTPKETLEKKLKTIMICRNPKDVVVSFYHHTKGIKHFQYEGKFENFLQMFMRGEVDYGSYPEYLLEWQQHIRNNPDVPFHILYYEDLKKNCVAELERLRYFLELDISVDLVEEIANNCAIDKMRAAKKAALTPQTAALERIFQKPGFSLIRKGQVGDWKNWFTVAQSEMFDAWWEKETKGLDMFEIRNT